MRKIAFLFPGQGSQYVGMARTLCTEHSIAEHTFQEANEVLQWDLQQLCFEGDVEQLTRTDHAQPALLVASVAAYRVYEQEVGLLPHFGAGHSLGEISALCCSGVLRFADALQLVERRGKLMHQSAAECDGMMLAVGGVELQRIQEEMKETDSSGQAVAEIACKNAPNEFVLTGEKKHLEVLQHRLRELGAKTVPLKVSAAFHSRYMQIAANHFNKELELINLYPSSWPVISNVTAQPYEEDAPKAIIKNLTKQLTHSVRWSESMRFLRDQGVTTVVEIGPKSVLKALMHKNIPNVDAFALDITEDFNAVSQWNRSRTDFIGACLAAAVSTQNHNYNEEQYHEGVIVPYRTMERMRAELLTSGDKPNIEQMRVTIKQLITLLTTKKVDREELIERIRAIVMKTGTKHVFPEYQ